MQREQRARRREEARPLDRLLQLLAEVLACEVDDGGLLALLEEGLADELGQHRDHPGVGEEDVVRAAQVTLGLVLDVLLLELGDADDMVFKRSNSKQKNGAVGILTDN